MPVQDQLKHWRSKISSNSQEWEDRNASLLAEKKSMSRHYQSLKSAMDSFRGAQGERLKQLSLQVLFHIDTPGTCFTSRWFCTLIVISLRQHRAQPMSKLAGEQAISIHVKEPAGS